MSVAAAGSRRARAVWWALACGLSTAAFAEPDGAAKSVEEIEITGTRIPREDARSSSPMTVLDAQAIQRSGASNLGQLLNELPQLGSTFSLNNSISPFGTGGLNLLDLRRLGVDRTLVLVDGLRHVGGSAGSTAVDINTIPVDWVERVEIITGGASAQYGADAVSGVVNFVLKKRVTETQARVQAGEATDSGFGQQFGSFSTGRDFAQGRGNAAFAAEFARQDRLKAKDRRDTSTQYRPLENPADTGPADGQPQRLLTPNAGLFALSEAGTVFGPDGGIYTFDRDGTFRPVRLDGIVSPSLNCSDCDFLDTVAFKDLQPKFSRYSANARVSYAASERMNLSAEAKFAHSDTYYQTQPAFDFFSGHLVARRDNALLPTTLAQYMDAQGLDAIEINRFNGDAGRRGEDNGRDTLRAVLAADGALDAQWKYRVAGVFGRSTVEQVGLNNRINDRFYAATDVVRDANGALRCRVAVDPNATLPDGRAMPAFVSSAASECRPANIFGAGNIDPASQAYYNSTIVGRSALTQTVLTAQVTNTRLFALPAGGVGFAGGVEYRRESSDYRPDALLAQEITFLPAIPAERGRYEVAEVFAELNLPLLRDLPGVQLLQIDLAGRASDYTTVGHTFSWKSGLDYRPVSGLQLRGSYAEAVRAPNITELYSPQFQSLFRIEDPCSSSTLSNSADPARRQANCEALGRPTNFEATADDGLVGGTLGGNPQLHEESASTYTLGAVFTPLRNLALSVDYWNIQIDDAIVQASAQDILNGCVDSASTANGFCGLISRNAQSFELQSILQTVQNVQALKTAGIDIGGQYRVALFGGSADVNLVATRLLKLRRYAFQDEPSRYDDEAGELGDPKWLANLSLGYALSRVSAFWKVRYIGPQLRIEREVLATNPERESPSRVGSVLYHNLQLRYDASNGINVYAGADNVFDKPLAPGLFGDGDAAIYDNIGRFVYAGLGYRF